MTWIYSCCWTDHSKGCPNDGVSFRDHDVSQFEAWEQIKRNRVRLGYDDPKPKLNGA